MDINYLLVGHKLKVGSCRVVKGQLQRVQQRRAAAGLRHHRLERDARRCEEGADLVDGLERRFRRRHDGLTVALAPHVNLEKGSKTFGEMKFVDTTTILITYNADTFTLIMTSLIMRILLKLNTGDITYSDFTIMTILLTLNSGDITYNINKCNMTSICLFYFKQPTPVQTTFFSYKSSN